MALTNHHIAGLPVSRRCPQVSANLRGVSPAADARRHGAAVCDYCCLKAFLDPLPQSRPTRMSNILIELGNQNSVLGFPTCPSADLAIISTNSKRELARLFKRLGVGAILRT